MSDSKDPNNTTNVRKTVAITADEIHRRSRNIGNNSCIPTITVIEGKNMGARLKILREDKVYTIGRTQECDLALDDDFVSREHSQIWREVSYNGNEKNSAVKIQDLNSTNKTLLNGKEIIIDILTPGVKITLGGTIMLFELLDPQIDKFYEDIFRKAQQANIDSLTQLLSKQFFLDTLPEIFDEAVANNQDFSLIVVDIDHFKAINDVYGHNMGDEALKMVASVIKAGIRKEDMAIRYGGDEILVALPGASLDNAVEIAERLRVSLQKQAKAGKDMNLTISLGVSCRRAKESILDLLKSADKALYASKKEGRNRVKSMEPGIPS